MRVGTGKGVRAGGIVCSDMSHRRFGGGGVINFHLYLKILTNNLFVEMIFIFRRLAYVDPDPHSCHADKNMRIPDPDPDPQHCE